MDPSTWVIPEENKIPHKQEFASIDSAGSGLIAGDVLVSLLEQSGTIDKNTAVQIFQLADVDKDGSLNDKEYCICKFLHMAAISQVPLPTTLPYSLIVSADIVPVPQITAGLQADDSSVVAPSQYQSYLATFQSCSENGTTATGAASFQIFSMSGLPMEELSLIWNLVDPTGTGELESNQFAAAMHLIHSRVKGDDLPNSLHPQLIASIVTCQSSLPSIGGTSTTSLQLQPQQPINHWPPLQIFLQPIASAGNSVPTFPKFEPVNVSLNDIQAHPLEDSPKNPLTNIIVNPVPIQSLLSQYSGLVATPVDLYDPATDIASMKNDTTSPSTTWSGFLSSAEVALKELRLELEKQDAIEKNLAQATLQSQESLKNASSIVKNTFTQMEQETEKVRFTINELSSLQTEIQVLVEELNSMKPHNFRYLFEQQQEVNQERKKNKEDHYDLLVNDFNLLSQLLIVVQTDGPNAVNDCDLKSLHVNNVKPKGVPEGKKSKKDSQEKEKELKKEKSITEIEAKTKSGKKLKDRNSKRENEDNNPKPDKGSTLTEKIFNPRKNKDKDKRASVVSNSKNALDAPQVQIQESNDPTSPKRAESTKEDKKKRRLSLWGGNK